MNSFCFDILNYIASYLNSINDILLLRHCCRNTYKKYVVSFESTIYLPELFITPRLNLSRRLYDSNFSDNEVVSFNAHNKLPLFTNLVEFNCGTIGYCIDDLIVQMTQLRILKYDRSKCITNDTLKTLTQLTHLITGFGTVNSDTISHLTNLVYLECGYDSFTDVAIKTLTKLTTLFCGESTFTDIYSPSLTYLDCGKSNFTDDVIIKCNKLLRLDCGYNNCITNKSVSCLKSLTILDCGYRTSITEEAIKELSNLMVIICRNKIISTDVLTQLPDLISLHCDTNDYISLPLPKLEHLTYSGRFLTDDNLMHLTRLETLDLSNCNQFTDNSLQYLTNLVVLECGNCLFTDNVIKTLTNLQYLNCCNSYLTDDGISNLCSIHSLISGPNCKFTDEGIKKMTNLSYLDCIAGTSFTDTTMTTFKKLQRVELYTDTTLTYRAFIRKTQIISVFYECNKCGDDKFPEDIDLLYPNIYLRLV